MLKNTGKKEKLSYSYTYLTSANIRIYVNSFLNEYAENEVLDTISKTFKSFGNVKNLDSIMSNKNEIKSIYQTKFPQESNKSDFTMKSELKSCIIKEHLNKLEISQYWSNFIFGFNAISRKLEKGEKFHSIFIDNTLKDAPILGHLRELANIKGNSKLIMVVFKDEKLIESVNTNSKRFGRVLMMGLLENGENIKEIDYLKNLLFDKVKPLEFNKLEVEKTETVQFVPTPTVEETKTEIKEKFSYVTDPGQVNILIGNHLKSDSSHMKLIKDTEDCLSGLKRKKVDLSQSTKFIQPPNKNQNKAKKKKAKKNCVQK